MAIKFLNTVAVDTDVLYVDTSNDRVGIGTTSPDNRLEIVGPYQQTPLKVLRHADYGNVITLGRSTVSETANIGYPADATLNLSTNGSERMRITSTGNVGIGTTSPDGKLEIVQTSGGGTPTLIVANDPSGSDGFTFQSWRYNESNTNFRLDLKQRVSSGVVQYAFDMVNNGVGYNSTLVLDRGNVGIGTASPTAKLQVYDDRDITSNSTNKGIRLQESTGDWLLSLGISSVTNTGFAIRDNVTSTYPFVIRETTGNVGIGTTSPDAKLDVNGGIISTKSNIITSTNLNNLRGVGGYAGYNLTNSPNGTGWIMVDVVSNGNDILSQSAYDVYASQNTYTRYSSNSGTTWSSWVKLIDSNDITVLSSNVGIGTTNPLEKLEVQGTVYATPISYAGNQSAYALKMGASNNTAFDMGIRAKSTSTGGPYMSFCSSNTEDVIVVQNSNVGINTASPSYNLDVTGTGRFTSKLTVISPISGNGTNVDFKTTSGSGYGMTNLNIEVPGYGNGIKVVSPTISGTDNTAMSFYQQTSTVGSITIGTSSTSFNTTSDYRLKENREKISDAIERVKELKPIKFNWIKEPSESKVDGFYAHELAEVVPEAVTGEKDALDWEGNPEYQAIDQAKIVPLLAAALQQAIDKIEALELRINKLENK